MTLVALVGCFVAAATYKLTAPATGADTPARVAVAASSTHVRSTPGPAAFGRTFVEAMNVQASRGHYMCSYVFVQANGKRECHLMQARWSPPDPVKVTRGGRVGQCETLRAALKSLR